jgi:hypothetical protein
VTLLGATDRAYLTAVHPVRYALGPPDAPLIVLNAADGYGCLWAADVPEGWDAPDVDTPLDRRPAGHGGYLGVSSYAPRVLTVEGAVSAPTPAALAQAYRRLLGALLGHLGGFLRYTHLDEDPQPMGLWVRPTGKPRWRAVDDRAAEFAFTVVAEDPIKTGQAATYGPIRPAVAGDDPGLLAPFTMPLTFTGGAGLAITVAVVGNPGDEAAHAVYTVDGPLPTPEVYLSTGEAARLNLTLTADDTAVIDTAAGTVTVNGALRPDVWAAGSTYPLIPAGGAEVRLRSATGGAVPDARLTILTAPAWK